MIKSLLIANRGEIARRIARTARQMGVRVIAVYSDEDEHAPHVREADEAVRLGPAPARDSYLKMDLILEAAKQTGAEAIHPGYGFLSENADFADACKAAGIIFVGPPASAIRAMGRKDEAKKIMDAAGVPITPGYMGDDQSDETLAKEADKTGYPLLIKAVSGGGGKGMRRVDEASEFQGALEAARREASSAFGDDRVLLEKFIENPRHVEVQIFGDSHGGAVHFFERDCSLQRRHQKVIEEAPAPGMSAEVREAICGAAVEAARAVGYESAGTVEFIADGSGDLRADGFWFMEMNTRLQVEHPVTEMVTGRDLVALQLHVAAGGAVPDQAEITLNGHAVEARLYAEDPSTGFLPSTGGLDWLRLPDGQGVRVDSGVEEGGAVSIHYDPMIAKIIVHAATREAAVTGLADAVERVEVLGVKTNAGFLARLLRRSEFIEGGVDTGFIGRHIETLSKSARYAAAAVPIAAALSLDMREERAMARALAAGEDNSPWTRMDGFRVNQTPRLGVAFMIDGERREVALSPHHGGYVWRHGDEATLLWIKRDGDSFAGAFGDETVEGRVMETEEGMILLYRGDVLRYLSPRATVDEAIEAEGQIEAPMPGKVLEVKISAGEMVTQGQTLVILEAMKMEQSLTAPRDGVAETVSVAAGDQVSEGEILVVLTEQEDEAA